MTLAVLLLCFLHLAIATAGLFTRNDLQAVCSNLSVSTPQAPQGPGPLNQGRVRPLFARRGQYERQRINVPSKEVLVPPNDLRPPSNVAPKPVKPNCSQFTQSCLPQSGCCDPFASCHCRFFNAICFCRMTNSLYKKKT
ncbi:agouti-related protein-like [Micropterus salmoides]|uniref:agouti-related protein-like n=1 Tax=Micropterus salmoides TaxID=27706 RepID=UPI0018EC086F|nr:agouti-related protein-like [Micropterus salmoides]